MNANDYENEILIINTLLENIIIKMDNYNKKYQEIHLNNKIKENMHQLFSNFLISKELINNTLYEIRYNYCSHDYIDDLIDINPELSQKIIYCKHCGLLKPE